MTETFNKKLDELDKVQRERVVKTINRELSERPTHNTKFLKGEFAGKRVLRIGDIRVVFIICSECRNLGHKDRYNSQICKDCEQKDDIINLIDIDFRGDVYGK